MRALKRFYRRQVAEVRLAPRRREIAVDVAKALGVPIRLLRTGARGHDSIYYVVTNGRRRGVLRVLNPFLARKPPPCDMPFVSLEPGQRLDREWEAYERLSPHGWSPQPLWRGSDALLCSYVDAPRFSDQLAADSTRLWPLAGVAARGVRAMHDAGAVHMDTCFANLLGDGRALPVWIDFEYGPAPGLQEATARAYDFLRLIESTLKHLTPAQRAEPGRWAEPIGRATDESTRRADVAPLRPALARLLADAALVAALRPVFPGLGK